MSSEESFCRLCWEKGPKYFSLFENGAAEMLESLTSIKVTPADTVSTLICPKCLFDLKTAYTTQQKIIKTETRHQEDLLAEFLINNHEELLNELLINRDFEGMKLQDNSNTENESPNLNIEGDLNNSEKSEATADISNQMGILCEHCGVIMNNSIIHKKHNEEAHADKMNLCETCDQEFSTDFDLNGDIKSNHENIKAFICDICNEAFSLRYVLKMHKLQHDNNNPFLCQICGRKFKYNATLNVHQKSKHGIEQE